MGKCVGCGRDVGVRKSVGRGVRRCVVGGVEKCFGVWGKIRKGVEKCGKVCLGGGKVRKSVGKVWQSVLGCWGGVEMCKSVGEGVGKCVGMWKRCGGEEKC